MWAPAEGGGLALRAGVVGATAAADVVLSRVAWSVCWGRGARVRELVLYKGGPDRSRALLISGPWQLNGQEPRWLAQGAAVRFDEGRFY